MKIVNVIGARTNILSHQIDEINQVSMMDLAPYFPSKRVSGIDRRPVYGL
jgi:hypothetical protein